MNKPEDNAIGENQAELEISDQEAPDAIEAQNNIRAQNESKQMQKAQKKKKEVAGVT